MYYVYMLRCEDNSIYTGLTTDVERRLVEHQDQALGKGAKYTKQHGAIQIEAVWSCENRKQASKLEYWIKRLTKRKKESLILERNLGIFTDKLIVEDYQWVEWKSEA